MKNHLLEIKRRQTVNTDGMEICLNRLADVQELVRIAQDEAGMVTLCHSVYTVDGKSLLGILSLDLSTRITLYVESGNYIPFEKFKAEK